MGKMGLIYTNEYQSVIQLIKTTCKKKKISQKRLAAGLKRNQSHISKIESGELRLNIIDFAKIMRLLDIDPTHVLLSISEGFEPIPTEPKPKRTKKS